MKPGKLLTLVIAAAVLVALAFWSSNRKQSAPPSSIGKKLLPALKLESVARVEIARQGAPIAIERGDDGWTVKNLSGYPADVSKLQSALLKLTDLRIGEVARGVNIDTNVTLVDLQGGSGKPLATLRLGSRPAGAERHGYRMPQGRYISVAGDPQVYLVKEGLEEFDGEPRDWVSSQLLNLSSSDIRTIELTNPTGTVLTLSRESGSLSLPGLSTNEEFDASKAYGVESALCYLNLAGVADPKLDDTRTGLATPGLYRVTMKNGDQYTARIGAAAASGDRYLRLDAVLAPPGTNATARAEQAARKADLDQKFGKWTYLVSPSTADNMTLSRADLVKPKGAAPNPSGSASTDSTAPAN